VSLEKCVEFPDCTLSEHAKISRIMKHPKTITFRMDAKKVKQLDTYAEQDERDRSYLLNEAVDRYLEVRQFQIDRIREGLCQAAAGDVVEHAEVVSRLHKRHSAR
jgi:predicted transcriptional regulator